MEVILFVYGPCLYLQCYPSSLPPTSICPSIHPSIHLFLHFLFSLKKKRFYLLTFREGKGGRKGGRETLICQGTIDWLPLTCPPPETRPATQPGTLTWNEAPPFSLWEGTQPTEPHQSGPLRFFLSFYFLPARVWMPVPGHTELIHFILETCGEPMCSDLERLFSHTAMGVGKRLMTLHLLGLADRGLNNFMSLQSLSHNFVSEEICIFKNHML